MRDSTTDFEIYAGNPDGLWDAGIPIAASRAGAVGLLNLTYFTDVRTGAQEIERLKTLGRGRWGLVLSGRLDDRTRGALGAARGADMEAIHTSVCQRFADPIASGQVIVHRAPSEAAMAGLADESLDFVYVAGDHSHDAVCTDLELAWDKCRPGGLIAVDDYSSGKWWGDDVIRATNEFIGRRGAAIGVVFAMSAQVVLLKR